MSQPQFLAVLKLIGCLEGIVSAGIITSADAELEIRAIIAGALAAFHLPGRVERYYPHIPRAPQ